MSSERDGLTVIGRLTSVFGVRGWVKVHAYGDSPEQIFDYLPWRLPVGGGWRELEIDEWRRHGAGLVVHIRGVDDRDVAAGLCQQDVWGDLTDLPELAKGDYYWRELIGLRAVTAGGVDLGCISSLLETGANDVLVVAPDEQSSDDRERLLPYSDKVVLAVDLEAGTMRVEWDPEF